MLISKVRYYNAVNVNSIKIKYMPHNIDSNIFSNCDDKVRRPGSTGQYASHY